MLRAAGADGAGPVAAVCGPEALGTGQKASRPRKGSRGGPHMAVAQKHVPTLHLGIWRKGLKPAYPKLFNLERSLYVPSTW